MQIFRRWCNEEYDASVQSVLVSMLVLYAVSFVMLAFGDKINSQNLVLTRYMARVQAPLVAHFYPQEKTRQITVILYDDEFLDSEKLAWPIPYGTHADWLERLTSEPDAKPKAIFLDITFGQARKDDSLPNLIETLCRIRGEMGIPIYLGALPSPDKGELAIRGDLMSARTPEGDTACVQLAGVTDAADPLDRIAWTYPLSWHRNTDGELTPGVSPDGPGSGYRSAATLLAEEVAGIDLGRESAPMALVWGPPMPMAHPSAFWSGCNPGGGLGELLIPDVLRQLWESPSTAAACPTHPTLSMSQVNALDPSQLAPYLNDTYLFIGGMISGYDDYAISPVHGDIPGVYVHAMALDNLLQYGDRYKQQETWGLPPRPGLLGAGLMAVAAVFLAHVLFRAMLRAWTRRTGLHLARPLAELSPFKRLLYLMLRGSAWVLRVWAQLVMALFMIFLLQSFFRIGMLPLVELIGMTLLAEGLGYLNAVRRFFAAGRPDSVSSNAAAPHRIDTSATSSQPAQEQA